VVDAQPLGIETRPTRGLGCKANRPAASDYSLKARLLVVWRSVVGDFFPVRETTLRFVEALMLPGFSGVGIFESGVL